MDQMMKLLGKLKNHCDMYVKGSTEKWTIYVNMGNLSRENRNYK